MKQTYFDLIDQTYYFPQPGFDIENGNLYFNNVSIKHIIDKYGTPLKISYLPRIGEQVKRVKNLFSKSIKANGYKGKYNYCYCTKSSHFSFIIKEVLKYGVSLETSSSYDLDIILKLHEEGLITKNIKLVQNGHKTEGYLKKIAQLHNDGFKNLIVVVDSLHELDRLLPLIEGTIQIGIRMAIDEEPQRN